MDQIVCSSNSVEGVRKIIGEIDELLKYFDGVDLEDKWKFSLEDINELNSRLIEVIDGNFALLKSKQHEILENNKNPLNAFVERLVCEFLKFAQVHLDRLSKFKIDYDKRKIGIVSGRSLFFPAMDQVQRTNISNMLSAFDVLKHLDGHNKTLIVMGPNGSGKTSLANYLKSIDDHVKVIPALKPLRATTQYIESDLDIKKVNLALYDKNVLEDNLLQRLIVAICKEHDDIAREYRDNPKIDKKSAYERIKEVFESFFSVSLNSSKFSCRQMMACKDQGAPFPFNDMSDGERAAFFYIATVLTAPEYSFIVVDEPENHLNPAIYNKMWNVLISLRNDCQFIFISHAVDFIKARINSELVKIAEYVRPDKFTFEFLGDSYESLPMENIVEIVGSRRPILFCEGTKSSDDYKIYEIFFGKQFTIIPAGTCEDVKHSVNSCNKYANLFDFQYAIGIIDSDLRDEVNIEKLKEKRIYSLPCNEIEMILLDEEIFKKALGRLYIEEDKFLQFQKDFFEKINSKKGNIVRRFAKNCVENKFKSQIVNDKIIKSKDDFCLEVKRIFENIDAESIWGECEGLIDDVLSKNDYQAALRYCCLQHNEVLNGIANRYIHNYRELALSVLGNDTEFAESIKKKYFSNICNFCSCEN